MEHWERDWIVRGRVNVHSWYLARPTYPGMDASVYRKGAKWEVRITETRNYKVLHSQMFDDRGAAFMWGKAKMKELHPDAVPTSVKLILMGMAIVFAISLVWAGNHRY